MDKGQLSKEQFLDLMAFKMIDPDLSEADIRDMELREAFQIFDSDGDGLISAKDLRELFKSIGEKLSVEEAEEMLKDTTINEEGIGRINFDEFKRSYHSFRKIKGNLSKKLGPEKLSSKDLCLHELDW